MHFTLLRVVLFPLLWTVVAATQYCSHTTTGPSFCASFATFANHSTGQDDLFLRYSAKPMKKGHGWIAMGTGDAMADSLMFVMWTDLESPGMALSTRTVGGHFQPSISSKLPDAELISSKVSATNMTLEALFACYGCGSWKTLDLTSQAQPWIWASNGDQAMESTDRDHPIQYHQEFGKFSVDMTTLPRHTDALDLANLPEIVETENSGAWDKAHPVAGHDLSSSSALPTTFLAISCAAWHGIVMVATFMIVLPFAHITQHSTADRMHLSRKALYIGTALACFGVLVASIWCDATNVSLHQALGIGVVVSLLMYCCWTVARQSKEFTTSQAYGGTQARWHGWCGGLLVAAGIVNIGLGLSLAGVGVFLRAAYVVVVGLGTLGYMVHSLLSGGRSDSDQSEKQVSETERLTAEGSEEV